MGIESWQEEVNVTLDTYHYTIEDTKKVKDFLQEKAELILIKSNFLLDALEIGESLSKVHAPVIFPVLQQQ